MMVLMRLPARAGLVWPRVIPLILAILPLSLGACRSTADIVAPPGCAICPVCRCEGDMACLVVEVGPDTPTLQVGAATYCFCSEDCRERFASDPKRYR